MSRKLKPTPTLGKRVFSLASAGRRRAEIGRELKISVYRMRKYYSLEFMQGRQVFCDLAAKVAPGVMTLLCGEDLELHLSLRLSPRTDETLH